MSVSFSITDYWSSPGTERFLPGEERLLTDATPGVGQPSAYPSRLSFHPLSLASPLPSLNSIHGSPVPVPLPGPVWLSLSGRPGCQLHQKFPNAIVIFDTGE